VVLLRELNVAADGSELVLLLGLGTWLLGSGLGAALGRRRTQASPLLTRLALSGYALLLPGSAAALRGMPRWLGALPGGALQPGQLAVMLVVGLLPCALLAGALFRLAARAWMGDSRSLAQAYGLESLGAVLGGTVSTGLVSMGLANLVAGSVAALVALVAAAWPGPGTRRWLWGVTLPCSIALALLLAGSGPLDRALTRLEHPQTTSSHDSPYGRVTVTQHHGQRVVFINGVLQWESQGMADEALAHLAALQVADPRSVLLLGGGELGLLAPLHQHAPERVDLVEPDPVLVELAARRILELRDGEREAQAFFHEAVKAHIDDPRAFLDTPARYDLILLSQPEPSTVAGSRTWTEEFFALCADHLSPGGVLAFALPGDENLQTPTLIWRSRGIHNALRSSFDDVLVLPGTSTIWLASRSPLEREPSALVRRMVARDVASRLVSAGYLSYLFENDRSVELAALLEAGGVPANSDDRPAAVTASLLLWLGRFDPSLALMDPVPALATLQRAAPAVVAGFGLLALALAALARRWVGSRRLALAALAGLLGTLLEAVLLLRFQVQHGVLYGQLGLLLGAFMAGLALGALLLDPLLRRFAVHGDPPRWLGWATAAGAAGVCLAVVIAPTGLSGLAGTSTMILASGAATALLFGLASRTGEADAARLAGVLYGADLMGGCAGVLLASLAIPLLGLGLSGGLGLGLVLAGLLLVP
jgi:spermidine synthase